MSIFWRVTTQHLALFIFILSLTCCANYQRPIWCGKNIVTLSIFHLFWKKYLGSLFMCDHLSLESCWQKTACWCSEFLVSFGWHETIVSRKVEFDRLADRPSFEICLYFETSENCSMGEKFSHVPDCLSDSLKFWNYCIAAIIFLLFRHFSLNLQLF